MIELIFAILGGISSLFALCILGARLVDMAEAPRVVEVRTRIPATWLHAVGSNEAGRRKQ